MRPKLGALALVARGLQKGLQTADPCVASTSCVFNGVSRPCEPCKAGEGRMTPEYREMQPANGQTG
jgi:hypothetical protein